MQRLIRGTFNFFIVLLFDIYEKISDFPRVLFLRRLDYSKVISDLEERSPRKVALVAPHPTQPLEFTMRNLVEGLVANDYEIVILMHDTAKAEWLRNEYPNLHIAYRHLTGRDFGAWKDMILSILESGTLLSKVENLMLVNDSIYWSSNTNNIIRAMTETDCAWSCLFENFEHHYHAQSFIIDFGSKALNCPGFKQFWAQYKPYSSRRHSIDNGEIMLSKYVSKHVGKPECLANSTNVIEAICNKFPEETEEIILRINSNLVTSNDYESKILSLEINNSLSPTSFGDYVKKEEIRQTVEKRRLSRFIARLMEYHNPTHTVALIVNRYLGVPIKRDLCQRGSYQIADIIQMISGYTEVEKRAINRDLRSKELPISMRGIKRILFQSGRI